jgi:hypothetical protein
MIGVEEFLDRVHKMQVAQQDQQMAEIEQARQLHALAALAGWRYEPHITGSHVLTDQNGEHILVPADQVVGRIAP